MKGKYLIIAFLASWTVITASKLSDIFESEYECPPQDSCPPKLISHETDCSKYYECRNGQKVLTTCAAGLYFSKSWRGCVDYQISDCEIPDLTTCTFEGQLLPHECKCKKYYLCKGGRKALRDCNPGTYFDKIVRNCVSGPLPSECDD